MGAGDLVEGELVVAHVPIGRHSDLVPGHVIPALDALDDRDPRDPGEPGGEAGGRARRRGAGHRGRERRDGGGEVRVVKPGERCVRAQGVVRCRFRPVLGACQGCFARQHPDPGGREESG